MKLYVIFFFLLSTSSLLAKDLTITVVDGWRSQPVPNAEVTLKSNVGKVLEVVKTDLVGKVVFKELTYGYHSIDVSSVGNDFNETSLTIKLEKHREITVFLEPTREYERRQLKWEDQTYGPVKSEKKSDNETTTKQDNDTTQSIEDTITTEVWAEFPGGSSAMKEFISSNLVYPEISRELGEQGRVYVTFIIEPDGVVTHVGVMRSGISREINREAMRLIRSMPRWIPGEVNGKKVRSRCRLPLTFTID